MTFGLPNVSAVDSPGAYSFLSFEHGWPSPGHAPALYGRKRGSLWRLSVSWMNLALPKMSMPLAKSNTYFALSTAMCVRLSWKGWNAVRKLWPTPVSSSVVGYGVFVYDSSGLLYAC